MDGELYIDEDILRDNKYKDTPQEVFDMILKEYDNWSKGIIYDCNNEIEEAQKKKISVLQMKENIKEFL